MKKTIWLMCLLGSMSACIVHKQGITYDFPAAMSEQVRAEYVKQWERGKTLYEMNCAQCHSKKVRGRTIVPDFTEDKLIGYELRVTNSQHESDIPETKVTTEELGLIMTFLTYKKKNK